MDNIKDNNYYLNKIIGYIEFILECTKDVSQEEFEKDEMFLSGISYKFIQIADSMSKLSNDIIENNQDIPWHKIRGLRNRLVHDYDNIYYDLIYNTVKNDLPFLLNKIKIIIF